LSLRHALVSRWWGGRIEIGDAESSEHSGGAVRSPCDRTFGGTAAEIDIDAHGLECNQRLGSRQIKARGF